MELKKTVSVPDRAAWRAWLEAHHETEPEVWLIFNKRHTGRPCPTYEEAVEEALCFGWIDSLMQRVDDERYAQKFTPRRPRSPWSELNRERVARLIAEGRMTPAGLAKVTYPDPESYAGQRPPRPEPELPAPFRQALIANPPAWDNYTRMPPSQRRMYASWVGSAKREETLLKRIAEAVEKLKNNEKLGLK